DCYWQLSATARILCATRLEPLLQRVPAVPGLSGEPHPRRLRPSRRLIALMRGPTDEEDSLTTTITEANSQRSQRPVLRRLVDILPAAEPVTAEPPPVSAPLAT